MKREERKKRRKEEGEVEEVEVDLGGEIGGGGVITQSIRKKKCEVERPHSPQY